MIRDDSETEGRPTRDRVARRAERRPLGGRASPPLPTAWSAARARGRARRSAGEGRGEARREKKLRTAGSVLSHARGGAFPWTA